MKKLKKRLLTIMIIAAVAMIVWTAFVSAGEDETSEEPIEPTGITWNGLIANGVDGDTTTTELTLIFDIDPVELTEDDIIVTGATLGELSGAGTMRTLTISDITMANGVSVTVEITSPEGYAITPSASAVPVNVAPKTLSETLFRNLVISGIEEKTEKPAEFEIDVTNTDAKRELILFEVGLAAKHSEIRSEFALPSEWETHISNSWDWVSTARNWVNGKWNELFAKEQAITFHASALFTVDLTDMDEHSVFIDDQAKRIRIFAPSPSVRLQLDETAVSEVISGLLRSSNDITLAFSEYDKLLEAAQNKMIEEAEEEFSDYAKENIEEFFNELCKSILKKIVNAKFEDYTISVFFE